MVQNMGVCVTKVYMNKPLCPCRTQTVAVTVRNLQDTTLQRITVHEPYLNKNFCYAENSAVIFLQGKKNYLKSHSFKNKITFEGLNTPPKEKALIFYRINEN